MKACILQRVIPSYRAAVFREITSVKEHSISVIIGDDIAGSKAKNSKDLSQIHYKKLPSTSLNIRGRLLTWHIGLLKTLRDERPDVIVCEAESHFLGYLVAIFYKLLFSRKTKLLLWCFYVLPGVEKERTYFHYLVKKFTRSFFSGFISYTSMGKKYLVSKGVKSNAITVAVNVCDTKKFIQMNKGYTVSKAQLRNDFGLGDKFVVSYIGTVASVKRPEVITELAKILPVDKFHFFVVGSGPSYSDIKKKVQEEKLENVTVTGRVTDEIAKYYRVSDAILIPGRGGIVISEAMCFGVPVIVHQADGIEEDLVKNGVTGYITDSGNVQSFSEILKRLSESPHQVDEMGRNAQAVMEENYSTKNMAESVLAAIRKVNGLK